MNVILVTTPIVNIYIESLLSNLGDNYVLIEYAQRDLLIDRTRNINSFVYDTELQRIVNLYRAKKYIQDNLARWGKDVHFYIPHCLGPLSNFIMHANIGEISIIPDGAMNYLDVPIANNRKLSNVISSIFKYALCGFFYRVPKHSNYQSENVKIRTQYYLWRDMLVMANAHNYTKLSLNCNFVVGNGLAILGQVVPTALRKEYINHIISIISHESTATVTMYYFPHPNESISTDFESTMQKLAVTLKKSRTPIEYNELRCNRFVGVNSSALMHLKLISNEYECCLYPKNFWQYPVDKFNQQLLAFESCGCQLIHI